jgi:hypothetical protein
MKVVRLSLPGSFEDAWFYKDRLLLWTTEGQTLEAPVEALGNAISQAAPGSGPLPQLLFTRNDWKFTALFEAMIGIPGVPSALDRLFYTFPPSPLELRLNALFDDIGAEQADGTLLDVSVYFNRFYLSTTSGLYDVDIDWEDQAITPSRGLRRRLEYRCVAASTGYGLVNASCEDNGLFTSFDEFGWVARTANDSSTPAHRPVRGARTLHRTDERSIRTAWLGHSLLNYRGAEGTSFIRSATRPSNYAGSEDRSVIVNYRPERYDLNGLLVAALRGATNARSRALRAAIHEWLEDGHTDTIGEPADFRIIANAGSNLVIESPNARVGLVKLRTPDKGPPELLSVETLLREEERIVSVARVRSGLVLESESAVDLWTDRGITRLVEGEAVRVRTFPNSKRYKDLVVVVLDKSVMLVGFYDEGFELY